MNEHEANALDQLRVADFQVELEPPKTNMFKIINEDHEDYFARHFEKMKPKIQALLDENRQLRTEIVALQKEVKHWRSARAWTKQKSESLQKMKSKCNQLSLINRKLNATLQQVEEVAPGFIRKLQRERGERTR